MPEADGYKPEPMTRRWTRPKLMAHSGWTPGAVYVSPGPSGKYGEPIGIDGNSDLRRVDPRFCVYCGGEFDENYRDTMCWDQFLESAT